MDLSWKRWLLTGQPRIRLSSYVFQYMEKDDGMGFYLYDMDVWGVSGTLIDGKVISNIALINIYRKRYVMIRNVLSVITAFLILMFTAEPIAKYIDHGMTIVSILLPGLLMLTVWLRMYYDALRKRLI